MLNQPEISRSAVQCIITKPLGYVSFCLLLASAVGTWILHLGEKSS